MILYTLEQFGFHWPAPVLVQSQQQHAYQAAFEQLCAQGLVYPCGCSRREVEDLGLSASHTCYAGTCRSGMIQGSLIRSWRLRVSDETIGVEDRGAAPISQALATEVGDFVLRRADGQWSYQLAVVVDDARQEVTDVVRGADLLDSTPRQIYLQRLLGLPPLNYLHVPLVLDVKGEKLSKHLHAAPLENDNLLGTLQRAASHLGLGSIACDSIAHFWETAVVRWSDWMDTRNQSRTSSNA